MGKKKKGKSKGGGDGGGGGGFYAEAAAAVSGSAGSATKLLDEPWKQPPDRGDAPRPTIELEAELAKTIATQLEDQKPEMAVEKLREPIPNIDLPNVVDQMQAERDRFFSSNPIVGDDDTNHRLARYGVFLRHVRERLVEEHKRATQKQKVAKALADRSRDEREWSQRESQLMRCNALVTKLGDAAKNMSAHVVELQASPIFIRAMAEIRARDMVCPGWDRSWAPSKSGGGGSGGAKATATQQPAVDDHDGLVPVEDGISFEALLRLEEDRGMAP